MDLLQENYKVTAEQTKAGLCHLVWDSQGPSAEDVIPELSWRGTRRLRVLFWVCCSQSGTARVL